MGKFRIRYALALAAALMAGVALALPFVSEANTASSSTTSTTSTTGTGTTTTTTTSTVTTTTTTKTTTPKPPPPPIAYSGYPEQITASSATLKGTIDPRGQATDYYFQYGTTPAYGLQTPPVAAGSANAESKVTQPIAGLQPYTTYHFRVVASSPTGTATGKDVTFTTKKIPLSLTATVAPNPVGFGNPLRVSGTLSGTGSTGAQVVVQADLFPYASGFRNITSQAVTNAAGGFAFSIANLPNNAKLRIATLTKPATYSPVISESVALRVSLHVRPARHRGFVHLYGIVTPSAPYSRVALEWRVHGRYVTIGGTRIRAGRVSRFGATIRLRSRGLYRVLVLLRRKASHVSGRSRPVLIR
jgi:hypothetical protein